MSFQTKVKHWWGHLSKTVQVIVGAAFWLVVMIVTYALLVTYPIIALGLAWLVLFFVVGYIVKVFRQPVASRTRPDEDDPIASFKPIDDRPSDAPPK